jgi:hypothetical protein
MVNREPAVPRGNREFRISEPRTLETPIPDGPTASTSSTVTRLARDESTMVETIRGGPSSESNHALSPVGMATCNSRYTRKQIPGDVVSSLETFKANHRDAEHVEETGSVHVHAPASDASNGTTTPFHLRGAQSWCRSPSPVGRLLGALCKRYGDERLSPERRGRGRRRRRARRRSVRRRPCL